MSEYLEYLYRCPICQDEKVETAHVVTLFCRKGHTLPQPMQYLGDQPASTGIGEPESLAELQARIGALEGATKRALDYIKMLQAQIKMNATDNLFAHMAKQSLPDISEALRRSLNPKPKEE